MKIGLLIIFNHRYDGNLQRLRNIYSDRFTEILFLIPFADELEESNTDVISVHHGSYTFQGFLGEARKAILDMNCDAWVILGDDLVLHPELNQSNLHERLSLPENAAYTKNLANLYDTSLVWSVSAYRSTFQSITSPSLQWRQNQLLPSPEEAFQRMDLHGFKFRPLGLRNLRNIESGRVDIYNVRMALGLFFAIHPVRNFTQWKTDSVPYPLLFGYSDFLICPRKGMSDFLGYCLSTAAMNLFVECAIPTSLALAYLEIVTELPLGENHHSKATDAARPMHGVELQWGSAREREDFEQRHHCSLDALYSAWPDDVLYYHPVKLSKWK